MLIVCRPEECYENFIDVRTDITPVSLRVTL
jgi:hypothetical protein